jgi:hypothetical protein
MSEEAISSQEQYWNKTIHSCPVKNQNKTNIKPSELLGGKATGKKWKICYSDYLWPMV